MFDRLKSSRYKIVRICANKLRNLIMIITLANQRMLAQKKSVFRLTRALTSTGLKQSRKQNWQSERLTDVGTRKIFNEEHDLFRETARKFFRSIPKERLDSWEKQKMAETP